MRLRLLVSSFASCGVACVIAQPNPSPQRGQPVESLPPIFAPRTAPPKGVKSGGTSRQGSSTLPARRAISPEMAANLSAIATRAAPSASASASGDLAATAPADSSDAVQLKPYVVHEDRLPEFKERDILTPKGKLALARRRYPGLVGPLSDATALRMLEDDFARERRREMADLQGLMEIGGPKPSGDLKRKMDDASMRPSGLSPQFGEPFRPPK